MTRMSEKTASYGDFAARLRRLRADRQLSARWVGREAGISSAAMTFIESGTTCPSAENLMRLADVLGVTMDELWRGAER